MIAQDELAGLLQKFPDELVRFLRGCAVVKNPGAAGDTVYVEKTVLSAAADMIEELDNTREEQKAEIICMAVELAEARDALRFWPPCPPNAWIYHVRAAWCGKDKILARLDHGIEEVRFAPAVMWDFFHHKFRPHYFLTMEEAKTELEEALKLKQRG